MNYCNICGESFFYENLFDKYSFLNKKFIRHSDFNNLKYTPKLIKCSNCQVLINLSLHQKKNFFFGKSYINSNQSNLFISLKKKKIIKSEFQANFIIKRIKLKKRSRILDIGCNKGDLLSCLKKKIKGCFVYGYDINKQIKKFLKKKKINFYELNKKNKLTFDLIIFSHSLFYIKNQKKLFENINSILKKNGKIFIEIPSIEMNPLYFIFGDQYYLFTKNSLMNHLLKSNFIPKVFNLKDYENTILISKKNYKHINFRFKKDSIIENSINKLFLLKKKLLNLKYKKVNILGTTSKAAFVHNFLGKKTKFFLDENINLKRKRFRNIIIKHPVSLDNKSVTFLPYNKNSIIVKKFKKIYKGKFISI